MNIEHIEDYIRDELTSAYQYAKEAVLIKPMSESWGATLIEMSATELDHVNHLYAMANELMSNYRNKYDVIPKCIMDSYNVIKTMIKEKTAKIESLHAEYKG